MADNKNLRNENDKLVKKVNAYLEEFGPLPTDFTGKYKLMSTDNYNGFLEYLEITDSEPNLINRLMPIIEIRSEDNVFTILAGNVIQDWQELNRFKISFKLNEEFETFDEDIGCIETMFNIEDDNKLIQLSFYNEQWVNIESELVDNELTIKGSVEDVVFTRVYEKIWILFNLYRMIQKKLFGSSLYASLTDWLLSQTIVS